MKKIVCQGVAALVANVCLLSSCGENVNAGNDCETTSNEAISFVMIRQSNSYRLEGSAKDFDRDADLVCFDSVSVVMPVVADGGKLSVLRDSIMKMAFDTVGVNPKTVVAGDKFAAELGYSLVKLANGDTTIYTASGFHLVNGYVMVLTSDRLTYCVTTSTYYPGAAHGYYSSNYLNYSIADGRFITLGDLFTTEGLEALPEIIRQEAMRQVDVIGPTSIEELPGEDNFYLSAQGEIVFAYQPYEVASYAQGEIKISFDPYQLCQYLSPDGLRQFGLSNLD